MDRARTAAKEPKRSLFFPVSVLLCLCAGVLLRAHALTGTFFGDDWDHYAMYAGIYPVARNPLDYFDFVGGQAERSALLQSGRLPWWTSPNLQLAVLRPVSSALVWFDFAVLHAEQQPWRAHVHSLLWWLILISGAAALLRRVLPASLAVIALALYVLDESQTLPLAWNANRSELVSIACVFWGTWAYVRARVDGQTHYRWIALALVSLGIAAGEHALPPLAYLVLFECIAEREPVAKLRALAPFAGVTVAYLLVRAGLGYSVLGSSFYADPFAEPVRFLGGVLQRFPLLVADLVFGLAGEWFYIGPPWHAALLKLGALPESWLTVTRLGLAQQMLGAVAASGLVVWLVVPKRTDEARSLRWLLWAALGSLVPACGTLAFGRMTLAAALGFCALWAHLGSALWKRAGAARGFAVRCACALALLVLCGVHVAHAAYRSHFETVHYAAASRSEQAWALAAELPHDPGASHVILIRALDWLSQFALPYAWHMHGRALPASYETLLPLSFAPLQLSRSASRAIELALPGPEAASFGRSVYALEDVAFKTGQRFKGARFDTEIVETRAGQPTRLRFTFAEDLDERYVFLHPIAAGLRRVPLPAVGASIQLPTPSAPPPR